MDLQYIGLLLHITILGGEGMNVFGVGKMMGSLARVGNVGGTIVLRKVDFIIY